VRVLGVARGVPLRTLERYIRRDVDGLLGQRASGVLLLIAYPTKALTNPLFYVKLALIAIGLGMWTKLRRAAPRVCPCPRRRCCRRAESAGGGVAGLLGGGHHRRPAARLHVLAAHRGPGRMTLDSALQRLESRSERRRWARGRHSVVAWPVLESLHFMGCRC
jgi:hypothetical protein